VERRGYSDFDQRSCWGGPARIVKRRQRASRVNVPGTRLHGTSLLGRGPSARRPQVEEEEIRTTTRRTVRMEWRNIRKANASIITLRQKYLNAPQGGAQVNIPAVRKKGDSLFKKPKVKEEGEREIVPKNRKEMGGTKLEYGKHQGPEGEQ